jgi:hypothetical protein
MDGTIVNWSKNSFKIVKGSKAKTTYTAIVDGLKWNVYPSTGSYGNWYAFNQSDDRRLVNFTIDAWSLKQMKERLKYATPNELIEIYEKKQVKHFSRPISPRPSHAA